MLDDLEGLLRTIVAKRYVIGVNYKAMATSYRLSIVIN